ncbi:MAG TPA: phosphatidylserine decarboxylase [Pilimelia sp.]|nr:phosphatidylserine decarboxylase [Pilimelia sp.]
MTQSPTAPGLLRSDPLGTAAVEVLTSEWSRHPGPKTGLLLDAAPGSPALDAVLDAVRPGDALTLVPADGGGEALRAHLAGLGSWLREQVTVRDALAGADPVDVLLVARPLTEGADEVRALLDGCAKYLAQGGVLAVTAPLFGDAAAELDRQSALVGVGADLVLRHRPPLRVHRLRWTAADPATAALLRPARRSASVRLTPDLHIDANGVAAAGLALGAAAVLRAARRRSRAWLLPALAAPAVAAFFRDPERDVPDDAAAVVAPADGKVLSVERLSDERFGGPAEWLRVAVFLSVLDVHVNRSPVAGRVADHFVVDGGYANAMTAAAEHNVAGYTVLDTPHGRVVVAQRTGLIARRIVHRAPVGALLARGERFGLIRFGSRTDVYLPADAADATVAPGERVVGGTSVIARWR